LLSRTNRLKRNNLVQICVRGLRTHKLTGKYGESNGVVAPGISVRAEKSQVTEQVRL